MKLEMQYCFLEYLLYTSVTTEKVPLNQYGVAAVALVSGESQGCSSLWVKLAKSAQDHKIHLGKSKRKSFGTRNYTDKTWNNVLA